MSEFYLQSEDKKSNNNSFMFYVKDNKIKGIVENGIHKRLTVDYIQNNPEFWFLMDKHQEFIYYSHKSAIVYRTFPYDLYYYICDF